MYNRLVLSLNDRAMALVVKLWPFTAENQVWSKVGPCEICGEQWHWNRLCPSNSVLPCQLVPIFHMCSILSLYTCCSYQEDKRTTSANASKWIDKYFQCFLLERVNAEMQTRLCFWTEKVMVRISIVDRLFCVAGPSTAAGGIIGWCAAAMSSALRTAVRP